MISLIRITSKSLNNIYSVLKSIEQIRVKGYTLGMDTLGTAMVYRFITTLREVRTCMSHIL